MRIFENQKQIENIGKKQEAENNAKINNDIQKYIDKKLIAHNSNLLLSKSSIKKYQKIIIKIIKITKRYRYIKNHKNHKNIKNIKNLYYKIFNNNLYLNEKKIIAIKQLCKGKFYIPKKYFKDVQYLI